MVLQSNIFPSDQLIEQMQIGVAVYSVRGVPKTEDRYEKLNHVARVLSDEYRMPASSLTHEEYDFIIMLKPSIIRPHETVEGRFAIDFIKQDTLDKYPSQAERIFYQVARKTLEAKGLWRSTYNRYYEYMPEAAKAGVETYRGLFFRFDVVNGQVLVTIDPIARVASESSLWEMISRYGLETVKRDFIGRSMLAEHGTRKSICTLANIDESTPITKESFEYMGKRYSVKGWLEEFNPSIAKKLADKEPTATIYYDTKPYNTAPSLLKRILSTEETPPEAKGEVYLTAEIRRKLAEKFLTYVNPLKFGNAFKISFQKDDLTKHRQWGVKDPPSMVFGRNKVERPTLQTLRGFKKQKLREFGPEKIVDFRHHVIVVYPPIVSEKMATTFYEDCKATMRKFFKIRYIPRAKFWPYSKAEDIRGDFEEFKENIDALIVAVRHSEDERYYDFKEIFVEKPNQVVTYQLINERYTLPQKRFSRYLNKVLGTCAGLLGKMGCRPWILGEALSCDVYIGLDIGGRKGKVVCYGYVFDKYGRHLGIGRWGPQQKETVDSQDLKRAIVSIIREKARGTITSLVIHRDGELKKAEIEGIKDAVSDLIKEGKISANPTVIAVNIKKTTPFRLYEMEDGKEKGCYVGSYLIIDDTRAIIATTGEPMLSQGIAKPLLIEVKPVFGDVKIEDAIKDVYYLSHLNWGAIMHGMKMPATIKYAEDQVRLVERGIYSKILPL